MLDQWRARILVVLTDGRRPDDRERLLVAVAARFADRFSPTDREYHNGVPAWHEHVVAALDELVAEGRISRTTDPEGRSWLHLQGEQEVPAVDETSEGGWADPEDPLPMLMPGVLAPPLRTNEGRRRAGVPEAEDEPAPITVELNLRFGGGVDRGFAHLERLWEKVVRHSELPERRPRRLGTEYATGLLSLLEMKRLVTTDAVANSWSRRCLQRLWPDFQTRLHVDVSCVTVKADAARRSFNAYGDRIVWAVIDSGIWSEHPHFEQYQTLSHESVRDLHRFFPVDGGEAEDPALALSDEIGHGTHVAGIIAGSVQGWLAEPGRELLVTESRYNVEQPRRPLRLPREVADPSLLAGMAPRARLVSLKVIQPGGTTQARVNCLIRALQYVRRVNGDSTAGMRIHGVNLSLGYEFDPEWFACGQSPLCAEVDRLVRSGVVVVASAGNSGYGATGALGDAPRHFGLAMSINDPGNAERAITVGSTHRDSPHTYGVSYFSSKGPTGDGRAKPDLLAPGERITSCAAGDTLDSVGPSAKQAVYVEDTGTSMAAPHVSGAAAALLSVRREFIGQPDRVKKILCDSAVPLGRTPAFEGAGLLDLMRALQIV